MTITKFELTPCKLLTNSCYKFRIDMATKKNSTKNISAKKSVPKKPRVIKKKQTKKDNTGKVSKKKSLPKKTKVIKKKQPKTVGDVTEEEFLKSNKGLFRFGPYGCLVPERVNSVVASDGMNLLSWNDNGSPKQTTDVEVKGLEMNRMKYLKLYCKKLTNGIWIYKDTQ